MKKNEITTTNENKTFKEKIIDWIFSILLTGTAFAAMYASEKCFVDLEDYYEEEHQNFRSNDEEEIIEEEKKYKRNKLITSIMKPVCNWSIFTFVAIVFSVIYATLFCKGEDEEE